jgi:hypothetical protein
MKSAEDKYQEELLLSRRVLRDEMRKAIAADSAKAKRELVATWKQVFKPEVVRELLACAKDYEARYRIANWNLEGFDTERRSAKR